MKIPLYGNSILSVVLVLLNWICVHGGTVFKRSFSCISYTFFSKRIITYYQGYTFENQDLKGFAYTCNFPILKCTHFLAKTSSGRLQKRALENVMELPPISLMIKL